MLKSDKGESRPDFRLDCDRFAAEQLRQRHISNVYRLTREERLRIVDPDYEDRQKQSAGFVLDGERYANSKPKAKEAFPYKPFFRKEMESEGSSTSDKKHKNRRRRRPAGTVGYEVSSADLKRRLEFDKAKPRIDAHGQVIKHEPKKVVSYKLPDYSKVSSKVAQVANSQYKRHGGNVRVKYGVAKKRRLPPLAPAPSDREAALQKRKELLREYTRIPSHAASNSGSPTKMKKPERKGAEAESDERKAGHEEVKAEGGQRNEATNSTVDGRHTDDHGARSAESNDEYGGGGDDDDDDAIELTDEPGSAPHDSTGAVDTDQ